MAPCLTSKTQDFVSRRNEYAGCANLVILQGMDPAAPRDKLDQAILNLLRENARQSNREIAQRVNLSPAAVGRRIHRLEKSGIIAGYTMIMNEPAQDLSLDALTELRFHGDTSIEAILEAAWTLPEVHEVYTTAGDPDAIVRVRVANTAHLQRVVNALRASGSVIGTKTLIILARRSRLGPNLG
jgi:Lrp/AsnC family transcriptional regulator, leucine-responsive regulatory protein